MYGLVIPLFLQVLTAPDDQSPEKKKKKTLMTVNT